MVKELKDFINDWKLDLPNKMATHNTGLTIGYDSTNEDGSLRLSYTGVMSFNKLAYSQLGSGEKVELLRNELTRQFVEIYKQKMEGRNFLIRQMISNTRE